MREIDVQQLKVLRDGAHPHVLLDVREPDEIERAVIDESLCIPMGEIPQRVAELPRDQEIVVMCHGGRRSAKVVQFLESQGFSDVVNLTGGIDAWSRQIDPNVPIY
ncbi:MAG TPA: rhodanese-like domain-containing protein [Candidatus Baltobacteraceae bacterium]|jgi:rhodanese-related sulfurtransferase|nr:rhodanese-like domain-containing protein [Candidatus Baltobacteraceae bacterium]